jgi:5-methyltetrahydropteroyltriglutamate--homocysteine methyltransferase
MNLLGLGTPDPLSHCHSWSKLNSLKKHKEPAAMIAANLGFPRIGAHRELKFALERFWAGECSEEQLQAIGRDLRKAHWKLQAEAGIQHIPSNDFSFYDHVLDMAVMLGAVPARFGSAATPDIRTYFAMARGTQSAPAMEMTKWFDTNYHYIVPEFEAGMEFRPNSDKAIDEFLEAKALGFETRPVMLGPVSFAFLGKCVGGQANRLEIVRRLIPVYERLLVELGAAGAQWVQIDEPFLGLDLEPSERMIFARAYGHLGTSLGRPQILLATYFSGLNENLRLALDFPVSAVHLDLVRAPEQLLPALRYVPEQMALSLGIVDGRNIWRTDFDRALAQVSAACDRIGPHRIQIAPSCSLLHVPVDLEDEAGLDSELRNSLAFARQKLEEVAFINRAGTDNSPDITSSLDESRRIRLQHRSSVGNSEVQARVAAVTDDMLSRRSCASSRRLKQAEAIPLPVLPTTTIGSFPQTAEVRRSRSAFRSGQMTTTEYEQFLQREVEKAIRFQEEIGLDVLVHGEFERNDMVEFFAEQMNGFAFTHNGWVQSYGSRCVKPPVVFGDISRKAPISVTWSSYAQSLTALPVKGMLTGPATMLQWSFVRDDLRREEVCCQLALALREEVMDLECAGLRVIQVDEPALREGLPLRKKDRPQYLRWAVAGFRLATGGVSDQTQIHTHMCYSEFGEILPAIKEMDADVISIEATRSGMALLNEISPTGYSNEIGPGVYDIHSPRVPAVEEVEHLIREALKIFHPEQLWINPDCGLKTRSWAEVRPALRHMLIATRRVRAELMQRKLRSTLPLSETPSQENWPFQACSCT